MTVFWTDKCNDLEGSRWSVWQKHFQNIIDWNTFKNQVLHFNSNINIASKWLFVKGWEYTIPTNLDVTLQKDKPVIPNLDSPTERIKLAQQLLKKDGNYPGVIDGILGDKSISGLARYDINSDWNYNRKVIAFLQMKAHKHNIDAGVIDGYWGPVTEYAIENLYQLFIKGKKHTNWRPEEKKAIKPSNNWPKQYSSKFDNFYGPKGEANLVRLKLPYKHRLSWDLETSISSLKCHQKVHDSLERVLSNVLNHYGLEEIKRLRLDVWGGCFNDRALRGGSKPSMHSWGIALDYDPSNNKLKWGRDKATFAQPEYDKWWQCWEEEGWISLGREKNFDWMHIQAARL